MTETYAELEIALHKSGAGRYQVELRFTRSESETEPSPERADVAFDRDALRDLELDPDAYGQALAASLFADANPNVRELYGKARAVIEASGGFLRLRLRIAPDAAELHDLRWELLADPETGQPLATSERTLFSRFMVSRDWRPVHLRPKAELRALVAVAAPSDLGTYQLADVDKDGEIARAHGCLEGVDVEVAGRDEHGRDEPLTLELLVDGLRGGVDILYLVCHGALRGEPAQPVLYLQNADATTAVVRGDDLAQCVHELQQPPSLVVLASCESAGSGTAGTARASLAPKLAEAGVAAIVAMQGKISMETVETMMPVFFRELMKDGQIDRAMAVARGTVRERHDAWMPALYLRLKRGIIGRTAEFNTDQDRSTSSFSISCSPAGDVRIFDPAGEKHDFTANLPDLSESETKQGIHDAKHWKQVHKLTEQVFWMALELRTALNRYRSDATAREAVIRILDAAYPRRVRLFADLERLPESVKQTASIDFLLKTRVCFAAIQSNLLASPIYDEATEQAVRLCERLFQWFYGGLVIADIMLEAFFHEKESAS